MNKLIVMQVEEFRSITRELIQEEFLRVMKEEQTQNNSNSPEPYIPRMQMAKELNRSLVTLRKDVKKGLPSRKLNGRVYFLRSEVDAHMEKTGQTKKG